ncbi:MAG: threonine--tRNA ligase [Nitrososphaerota archaeon]|nr:threonine--tRNA ligase [Nitrososphaerota archaeon]MDG6919352.1 threonine--tRNA ligase [Nitrososphaerota archaeon]MDG6946878.1 threonine--tRNA ligase [Nitrososphaerota archaeon]
MKILQMHADFIEYTPVKKEIRAAEEADSRTVREEDIVVLFTAFEAGDDAALVKQAVAEAKDFLARLGATRVMLYPFAHLSQDLAPPGDALQLLLAMEKDAAGAGLEVRRAPFGWTKALQIKVKGHPLAEMSRSYGAGAATERPQAKGRPKRELTDAEAMGRLRRSDFVGLPEGDHRTIGERLDLFSFQEVSPGMVYLHAKGLVLRNLLVDFLRGELARGGYQEVSTPTLANTALWQVSGHSAHYKDNMFLTALGDEEMGLKPMNCPSHFLIYRSRKWSFRELPVRYAAFDPLFRNELSGVSSGLFRVKSLTQDDAHVIATEEQAEGELAKMLEMMERVYGTFGLQYKVKISTRPDDSMGTNDEWERATGTLVRAVKSKGWPYEVKEKEGNFYSPKIDVDVKDSLGREWQCGTFQLDFQMPKRFKLSYTGSDGKEHTPVVLHRTILGSLERFMGVILEHYRGSLPVWLSPVQARVIPLSDEHLPYATTVLSSLVSAGVRAEGDFGSGTMGGKIRDAQLQKIPYMLVVGKKEEDSGSVAVRTRGGEQTFGVNVGDFVARLKEEVAAHR